MSSFRPNSPYKQVTNSTVNTICQNGIFYEGQFRMISIVVSEEHSGEGIYNSFEVNWSLVISSATIDIDPTDGSYSMGSAVPNGNPITLKSQSSQNAGEYINSTNSVAVAEFKGALYVVVLIGTGNGVGWFKITPGTNGELTVSGMNLLTLPVQSGGFEANCLCLRNNTEGGMQLLFTQSGTTPGVGVVQLDGEFNILGHVLMSMVQEGGDPAQVEWTGIYCAQDQPYGRPEGNLVILKNAKGKLYTADYRASETSLITASPLKGPPAWGNPCAAIVPGPLHGIGGTNRDHAFFITPTGERGTPCYGFGNPKDPGGITPHNITGTQAETSYCFSAFATLVYAEQGDGSLISFVAYGLTGVIQAPAGNVVSGFSEIYLLPGAQLQKQQDVAAVDTSQTPNDPALIAPYQNTWRLLGMFLGAPPYHSEVQDMSTSVELAFSKSNSKEIDSSFDLSCSISAGDKLFGVLDTSLSYTRASSHKIAKTTTMSLSFTETLSNGTTNGNQQFGTNDGWLIFIQPIIQPHIYEVYSTDGTTDLGVKVHLLEVLSASTNYVTFDMTRNNGDNIAKGIKVFPPLNKPEEWKTNPIDLSYTPNAKVVRPNVLHASDSGSSTSTLSTSQTIDTSYSLTNAIKASAGAFGFSADCSGSFQLGSSVESEIDQNFTATMGPIDSQFDLEVQPFVYYFTSQELAKQQICPDLFPDQPVWVVCWQVLKCSSSVNESVG